MRGSERVCEAECVDLSDHHERDGVIVTRGLSKGDILRHIVSADGDPVPPCTYKQMRSCNVGGVMTSPTK